MITGEELFKMWVAANLCHDKEYLWGQLSLNRQEAWNRMAKSVNEKFDRRR